MTNTNLQSVSGSLKLLNEATGIIDSEVGVLLKWYESHTLWPRLIFRFCGAVVILLSVSLPYLANLDAKNPSKATLISIAALLIALLSSLNSFFGWERIWQSRIEAKFLLQDSYTKWRLAIAKATSEENGDDVKKQVVEATEKLLQEARDISRGETAQFFASLKWPDARGK